MKIEYPREFLDFEQAYDMIHEMVEDHSTNKLYVIMYSLLDELKAKRVNNRNFFHKNRAEVLLLLIILGYELADREDIPVTTLTVFEVVDFGANKYGANSWLDLEVFDTIKNAESMERHLTETKNGLDKDYESNLPPLAHMICRASMEYTRIRRGIVPEVGRSSKSKVKVIKVETE